MYLSSRAIRDVVHPTAAFSSRNQARDAFKQSDEENYMQSSGWESSQLNPKNRIDSLTPLENPLWRIDGCAGFGTQFYLVPVSLPRPSPMRFDAFIPEQATHSTLLRDYLDLDQAFHTKDATRVRRLAIATHLLRSLQYWTTRVGGLDAMENMYRTLPFGSRIVFRNIALNIHDTKIEIAPTYNLEHQMLSLGRLSALWHVEQSSLPPTLDITLLTIVEQLTDSVCLVRPDEDAKLPPSMVRNSKAGETWILKALTSSTKYLYHEIRTLLAMEAHSNVIDKPVCLVTKHCLFGGKIAVVGFMQRYHPGGSLRDALPLRRISGRLSLDDQLRWAAQITSGLLHIRQRGHTYYPDLRLDNVVLSADSDAIIVDFEQRGVWCEFSSPEINALEYIRILASDHENDVTGPSTAANTVEKYTRLLNRFLPGWEALQTNEEYTNPRGGYNVSWLCLSATEQEASEVYMLGRLLWCIFEAQSAPQEGTIWQSYRWEAESEFPEYQRTPPEIRVLIDACTRGRREALSAKIIRRGSRLVFRDGRHSSTDPLAQEWEIRRFAKEWWTAEIKASEDFLRLREEKMKIGQWSENYFDRPTLSEVWKALEASGDAFGAKGVPPRRATSSPAA